jgi:hypothetical protein
VARARAPPVNRTSLLAAALPVVALTVFAVSVLAVLAAGAAAGTLGYDYQAYDIAARRLLAGQPLYDTSFAVAGVFGLFFYPPPFILIVLPLAALLPAAATTWVWIGLLVVAFLVGVAVLPVRRATRWWIVLLAGLDYPFVYALKLGQVAPLLFLTFAIGWRWLDRPARLGISVAAGTLIKLQPGIVLVWAALTGRWRAIATAILAIGVLLAIATVVVGPSAWTDFVTLVGKVSDPITTPHNFTPGAVAYQLGVPAGLAAAIQAVVTVVVVILVVLAALRRPAVESYLVAVVASQLLSPVLWDHYAAVLLLPVAYFLDRGQWWAALVPLATAWPLVGLTPAAAYPLVFGAVLMLLVVTRPRSAEPANRPGLAPAVLS